LKNGGRIVVFDKFVPRNRKVSSRRRLINVFANLLFTDITRDFESLLNKTRLTILSDEEADFKGNFRRIKLIKNDESI
jgi:phosphatidylethanolamine/phosphatidyl-N-methylethanolamine N-methyltransferase